MYGFKHSLYLYNKRRKIAGMIHPNKIDSLKLL